MLLENASSACGDFELATFDLPDLRGSLILGVARDTERCPFHRLRNFPLRAGDLVVYLAGHPECDDDVALP